MIDDSRLIWREISKKEIFDTPVFKITETDSVSPEGKHGNYIVVDARDWATVIPVTGEDFLMVKQWRHGEGALSIEFPGGVIESGEKPEEGARRELLEETGCVAGTLVHLGSVNPNPALFSNHFHVFLALDLQKKDRQRLDADEFLNCRKIPVKEVCGKMGSKEYPHALMAAALMMYIQYNEKNKAE